MLTSLSKHFGDDISISEIKTNFSNEDINSKLILTTEDNIDVKDNNYVVKITPFLTDTDVIKIKKMINKIRHDVQTDKIIKFLHEFTSPNLFFNDLNFKNKKQCLVYAADKLLQYQYVGKDFLNEICERERMAPTLFDTVAMPHSLKLNAKKSQMVVMINNKPIKWSVDNKSQLIILISVNKNDRDIFEDLLQALIDELSIRKNVQSLINSNNYNIFYTKIVNLMKNKSFD
ncbi:PTS sugar transporter subunit IIA [Oenococcus oeni]|uniref:PTS sugar transporter subunit IIA n=3 Tax=Oenococcus oeni TaxID=1247 RepID=UPI00214CC655|nr:PTS sugar transporter subunit IIA [Oenococcus oeni]